MTGPELTVDELLTTTRAVRKRLDLERPVDMTVVRDCIEIALQAPSGGNTQNWHFLVVTDPEKRAGLADIYARGWERYQAASGSVFESFRNEPDGPRKDQLKRVASSANYLADNLAKVPVLLIPCIEGRPEQAEGSLATIVQASTYGSILPAAWSYMLAARSRGLGTAWTTVHLMFEEEAAELLDIPYAEVTQTALIPTAWYTGETFRPALRKPIDSVLHVNGW